MEEIPQTEAELPTLPEGSVEGVDCYERLESLLQGRQKDPCDEGAGCSRYTVELEAPTGGTDRLQVVREEVARSWRGVHCDYCRVHPWTYQPVASVQYHLIVPADRQFRELPAPPSGCRYCRTCGTLKPEAERRCAQCGYDASRLRPHTVERTTHRLHALVHASGRAHLLRVNGHEAGSKRFSGKQLMRIFHSLCFQLRVVAATVEDVSEKGGARFAPIHSVAYGQSWYGIFGYNFATGCFGASASDYNYSLATLRHVRLRSVLRDAHKAGIDCLLELERVFEQYCPEESNAGHHQPSQHGCDGTRTLADLFHALLVERAAAARSELRFSVKRKRMDSVESEQRSGATSTGVKESCETGMSGGSCMGHQPEDAPNPQQSRPRNEDEKDAAHGADVDASGTHASMADVFLGSGTRKLGPQSDMHITSPVQKDNAAHGLRGMHDENEENQQFHTGGRAPPLGQNGENWLATATQDLVLAANKLLMEYAPARILTDSELAVPQYRQCMEVVRNTKHFSKTFIDCEEEMLQLARRSGPEKKNGRPALLRDDAFAIWCQPLLCFDPELPSDEPQMSDPAPIMLYLSTGIDLNSAMTVLNDRLHSMYPCLRHSYASALVFIHATKLAGFTGKLKGSVLLARHIYKMGVPMLVRVRNVTDDTQFRFITSPLKNEVRCSCGCKGDDGERMAQCDRCKMWAHTRCSGICDKQELRSTFACSICKPPSSAP